MKLVAVILLLSLALSSSQVLYPAGSKVVVIRIDDIQDYSQASSSALVQRMVLEYHIDHHVPALLAIIVSMFGKDPQLVDQIKNGLDQKIFTVAIHGWNHVPYTGMSLSAQTSDMEYGVNRLDAILGTQALAFVPPYSNYTDATIAAMKRNHLTLMSSATYVGDVPREEDGITFIPETVETATVELKTDSWVTVPFESVTQQIQDSWESYGLAVVVIHPRQFTGEDYDGRWNVYLRMIEWIQANHGTIIRPEAPTPRNEYNLDPFSLSVGIITGIVSILLVTFTASVRRNRRKRQDKTGRSSQTFVVPPVPLDSGLSMNEEEHRIAVSHVRLRVYGVLS